MVSGLCFLLNIFRIESLDLFTQKTAALVEAIGAPNGVKLGSSPGDVYSTLGASGPRRLKGTIVAGTAVPIISVSPLAQNGNGKNGGHVFSQDRCSFVYLV
jgi:hypothetical protein